MKKKCKIAKGNMRKQYVILDLDVRLETSKLPPSIQSGFDFPAFRSKYNKRFLSPVTFGDLRSLASKRVKVFKNKNCLFPFPVYGLDNEILCYFACGFCDSCKQVISKMRSKKNVKKANKR